MMKQTFTTLLLLAVVMTAAVSARAQGCNNGNSANHSSTSQSYTPSFDARNFVPVLKITTQAFPNPSTGLFTFALNANRNWTEAATLEVVDLTGHVIRTIAVPADEKRWETPIDLSTQRPGIYLVRIRDCAACQPVKLVVSSAAQP
ncbi:MAG: T9SS C-terminal target domain-containing protein [Bacteroidetes bacterium]|nr:MAG: T9SS C-terminal target domain-containing protein [Bacteroidota bacterium]